jgi:hypothetical protein
MAKDKVAKSTGAKKPVSAFDLFSQSSKIVQSNLGTFAIIYILPFLSSLGYLRSNTGDRHADQFSGFGGFSGLPDYAIGTLIGFGIILFFVVIAVSLIVNTMKYGLELQSAQGKKPKLEELWPFVKKYWLRLIGLLIAIGLLVLGGLILLIVPGLIAIRRYFLAPYVMMDKDVSISEALRQSAALTKPYSGSIWGILGVMLLISLPSAIPVFGWAITFVLTFLYSVAPALRYEELKKLA